MVRDMFEDIEQECDIPATFPRQVKQIDLVSGGIGWQGVRGHFERGQRRIGQGQLGDRHSCTCIEVANPASATAAEIDHVKRNAEDPRLSTEAMHGMQQEPMTAPIPEVSVLHLRESMETSGIVFVFTMGEWCAGHVDAIFQAKRL